MTTDEEEAAYQAGIQTGWDQALEAATAFGARLRQSVNEARAAASWATVREAGHLADRQLAQAMALEHFARNAHPVTTPSYTTQEQP